MQQMNSPLVDVLLNTAFLSQYTLFRRLIQSTLGPAGGPFAKWQVQVASAPTQNFKIDGGGSSLLDGAVSSVLDSEGPARFFLGGHMCLLKGDKNWRDNATTRPGIHSQLTAVSGATVTDTSAFFELDGDTIVGRPFFPDITDTSGDDSGPLGFTILSVTDENTLILDLTAPINQDGTAASFSPTPSTLADFGTVAGDFYRIGLTTSTGGTRYDTVVLDVYEDEADSSDDAIVKRSISGTVTESANALVVRQRIEVLQNLDASESPATFGDAPIFYDRRTDHDGNVHHRVALAVITREDAAADIATITNLEANTNTFWALTFGTLPPTTTDSSITNTTSGGVDTAPGEYGGATLEIPRLLLQMMGNVSDAQNQAFQNAGDHLNETDVLTAGQPGKGSDPDPSVDGRHIGLFTNTEMGAIYQAAGFSDSGANSANCLVSKQGHLGKASSTNDDEVTGALPHHGTSTGGNWSIEAIRPFNSVSSIGDIMQLGTSVIAVGHGWAQYQDCDSDGFHVGVNQGAVPHDTHALFEDLGIPMNNVALNGLTTKSAIQARYVVVPTASLAYGQGKGGTDDLEGGIRIRGWDVVNGLLSVRIDLKFGDAELPGACGTIFLISK